MKENKQPVVYVARQLNVHNGEGDSSVIGWFVSKASLTQTTINYYTNGEESRNYIVDFNLCPAIFAMDDNVPFYAENGDGEPKSEIFKDYKSCKNYVTQLNNRVKQHHLNSKSAYRLKHFSEKLFFKAMEYANYLEEKFIPEDERQEKDPLLDALESARGL